MSEVYTPGTDMEPTEHGGWKFYKGKRYHVTAGRWQVRNVIFRGRVTYWDERCCVFQGEAMWHLVPESGIRAAQKVTMGLR